MELEYVGPKPDAGKGAIPLPEGWPAANHEELDEALATEKVASGMYRSAKPKASPSRGKSRTEEE